MGKNIRESATSNKSFILAPPHPADFPYFVFDFRTFPV